ncbi:MAG: hypothetical protein HGA47_12970, partial [Zoogloea sp.]|nr:hypothetical protein [Zoogloea sp.]
MACTVYCLVSSIERLPPLVERLKEAGVSPRDTMVVLREDQAALASAAVGRRMLASGLAPILWSLPLGSAWWWLALSICG